ncbi:unnamed protein product [Amoebophrya sp. A120]|nr:unnamed protein product [Amoebophrya sp. A120]|eukprot:GSA120T00013107001.1
MHLRRFAADQISISSKMKHLVTATSARGPLAWTWSSTCRSRQALIFRRLFSSSGSSAAAAAAVTNAAPADEHGTAVSRQEHDHLPTPTQIRQPPPFIDPRAQRVAAMETKKRVLESLRAKLRAKKTAVADVDDSSSAAAASAAAATSSTSADGNKRIEAFSDHVSNYPPRNEVDHASKVHLYNHASTSSSTTVEELQLEDDTEQFGASSGSAACPSRPADENRSTLVPPPKDVLDLAFEEVPEIKASKRSVQEVVEAKVSNSAHEEDDGTLADEQSLQPSVKSAELLEADTIVSWEEQNDRKPSFYYTDSSVTASTTPSSDEKLNAELPRYPSAAPDIETQTEDFAPASTSEVKQENVLSQLSAQDTTGIVVEPAPRDDVEPAGIVVSDEASVDIEEHVEPELNAVLFRARFAQDQTQDAEKFRNLLEKVEKEKLWSPPLEAAALVFDSIIAVHAPTGPASARSSTAGSGMMTSTSRGKNSSSSSSSSSMSTTRISTTSSATTKSNAGTTGKVKLNPQLFVPNCSQKAVIKPLEIDKEHREFLQGFLEKVVFQINPYFVHGKNLELKIHLLQQLTLISKFVPVPKSIFAAFMEIYNEYLSGDALMQPPKMVLGQIRELVDLFHRFQWQIPEKMKSLYRYAETVAPVLDVKTALITAHELLESRSYSETVIATLLHVPMHASSEVTELRLLKSIEMLIRLDTDGFFSQLREQHQLQGEQRREFYKQLDLQNCENKKNKKDNNSKNNAGNTNQGLEHQQYASTSAKQLLDFLSAIQNWEYTPPKQELERCVVLNQVAHFLEKHGFPCDWACVGPYALSLCDKARKVAIVLELEDLKEDWSALAAEVQAFREKCYGKKQFLLHSGNDASSSSAGTAGDVDHFNQETTRTRAGEKQVDQSGTHYYRDDFDLVNRKPFQKNLRRHLRMLDWKVIEIPASFWRSIVDYDERVQYVRALLRTNGLLQM